MEPELTALLEPFGSDVVKTNPSGGGQYVKHSVVVERLLSVVGPYDYRISEVLRGDVAEIPPNPNGQSKRAKEGAPALHDVIVGCLSTLTVTIGHRPVSITEVGDCEQPHNWATDGARLKDASSDAIKRCAMRLGVGLHLWSQELHHRDTDASEGRREHESLVVAQSQLKTEVEQLSVEHLNEWQEWKDGYKRRTGHGFHTSVDGVREARTRVGEWLAEAGAEPFGDVTPTGAPDAPAGDPPPTPPAGEPLPPTGEGTETPPHEETTATGLVAGETEQQENPPGDVDPEPGGYLHPSGRTYPWPAGRVTVKWTTGELAAWLKANDLEIPAGKTARLKAVQDAIEQQQRNP